MAHAGVYKPTNDEFDLLIVPASDVYTGYGQTPSVRRWRPWEFGRAKAEGAQNCGG